MKQNKDFLFFPKVDLNEGFTTGTITNAAVFMTPSTIFVIPFKSVRVLGNKMTTTMEPNAQSFLDDLLVQTQTGTLHECEKKLKEFLPAERIFPVAQLKKFSVQVGWWLFGALRIAKEDGTLHTFNIQPKEARMQIKEFYQMYLTK